MVSTVTKLSKVLRYLELGGELSYRGYTIVWLDNHVTHTLSDGTQLGINGIAFKGVNLTANEPTYMGCDFGFNQVVSIVDELTNDEYLEIVTALALRESHSK